MSVQILTGDCRAVLQTLPGQSVHCAVSSPPYWGLRDYGVDGQIGLEAEFGAYVEKLISVFREVRRVLRDDGTLWLNLGDSYATGAGAVGKCPGGGKQGENWAERGVMTSPNRMPQAGLKAKDLVGIPWRVAFALQADGWYLRQDIIWSKPNPMPESVTDRCTKAHEYLFLLSKLERYYFDQDAILEPCSPSTHARLAQDVQRQIGSERAHAGGKTNGTMKAVRRTKDSEASARTPDSRPHSLSAYEQRKIAAAGSGIKNNTTIDAALAIMPEKRNKRSVWTIPTQGFSEAHFATFPPALIEPCILAGCPKGGTVLDPFGGAGTTGMVADRLGRDAILIELNPAYAAMAAKRVSGDCPLFAQVV